MKVRVVYQWFWDKENFVALEPYSSVMNIAAVDEATLLEAQDCVSGCEHCADNATITFDYLLDAVTGCDPATEYAMDRSARCPRCNSEVTEKTFVVA